MIYEFYNKNWVYAGDVNVLLRDKYASSSLSKKQYRSLGEFIHLSKILFKMIDRDPDIWDFMFDEFLILSGMKEFIYSEDVKVNTDLDILFNTICGIARSPVKRVEFYRTCSWDKKKFILQLDEVDETDA